jgi:membrane peptidoglycan carboxypeptidase
VLDGPLTITLSNGQTYTPHDYDMRWHGIVPIEVALGNSLNVPAIKVELLAGIPSVIQTARRMGVTTLTRPASYYGPSLTLGTYPVPLWEMAQAATAYADQGTMHDAEFVLQVTDGSGRTLYTSRPSGKAVMDPGVAFIMNQILSNDANRVMEFGAGSDLTLAGHVVSAKTGTTQEFRDNVTVGWTPHLVTATWVGNADDSPMQGTTGITGAAPIWHDYMTTALQGTSDDWPAPPPDVVQETVGQPLPVSALTPSAPASPSASASPSPAPSPSPSPGGPVQMQVPPVLQGLQYGETGWFLTGTNWTTGASQLSGQDVSVPGQDTGGTTNVRYSGNCRYWTYQGGNYWYCGSGMSGLPGDPGPQQTQPAPGPQQGGGPAPPGPGGGGPSGGGSGGGRRHH